MGTTGSLFSLMCGSRCFECAVLAFTVGCVAWIVLQHSVIDLRRYLRSRLLLEHWLAFLPYVWFVLLVVCCSFRWFFLSSICVAV